MKQKFKDILLEKLAEYAGRRGGTVIENNKRP